MNLEDLNTIEEIINEFEGETVLGKHMFKAIKAYYKQQNKKMAVVYTPINKPPNIAFKTQSNQIKEMSREADEALLRFNKKLRKRGKNGTKKTKKAKQKANS